MWHAAKGTDLSSKDCAEHELLLLDLQRTPPLHGTLKRIQWLGAFVPLTSDKLIHPSDCVLSDRICLTRMFTESECVGLFSRVNPCWASRVLLSDGGVVPKGRESLMRQLQKRLRE